jgi:hypothetical protein
MLYSAFHVIGAEALFKTGNQEKYVEEGCHLWNSVCILYKSKPCFFLKLPV